MGLESVLMRDGRAGRESVQWGLDEKDKWEGQGQEGQEGQEAWKG